MKWKYESEMDVYYAERNDYDVYVYYCHGTWQWHIVGKQADGRTKTLHAAKLAATRQMKAWEGEE